jgi:hypothetical protein
MDLHEEEVATPSSEGEEPLKGTEWFTQEETINHRSKVADEIPPNTPNAESDTGNQTTPCLMPTESWTRSSETTSIRTWGNI